MNKEKVFTIIGYEYKELLNDGQFFIVYKMKNNLDNEIRLYLESDLDRLFEVKTDRPALEMGFPEVPGV